MNITLTETFELKKGKHLYVYDPAGFEKEKDGLSPIFKVDTRIINIDQALERSYEGCAYLVCGCNDYKRRAKKCYRGESYQRLQESSDFGWDCVATCQHISLIRRYLAISLIGKTLETIAEQEQDPSEVCIQ